MRPNLTMLFGTTALVAALVAPGAVQAQSPGENQSQAGQQQQSAQEQQQRAETRRTTQKMTDRDFIEQAAFVNMFEVRAGEMALDRSQDQEVRDFAQKIVDDHRRLQNRLTKVAGKTNIPSQLDRQHSSLMNRLERTSDDRFDRRFIRMQVRGHEQAVDLFESFIEARQDQADGADNRRSQDNAQSQAGQMAQDQSSQAAAQDGQGGPPLLQYAQQNLPALERHLRSAREIRANMRSGPDVAASQQSQSQRRQSRADGRSEQSRTQDGDTARRFVVEQPRPRVTVTDPRSQVNIEQPQPRVTVRQQAPTVTIDQPPPEIVVHMPRPQVDVQDRQPRVSVNVPKPQVNVEQEGGSARVQVQDRSDEEAQVQYQRARPQVQFERAGEPRVVYRPTEQEPKIRYESEQQSPASAQQQAAGRQGSRSGSTAQSSDAQTGAQQATTAQHRGQGEQDWRDRTRQLAGADEAGSTTTGRAQRENADSTTTGRADAAGSTTSMLVSRINDMPVYNARGQKLGDVEEVVVDEATDKRFVILASGGFLGLFEDEVALPLDRFRASGDRLVVSGLTNQDIDNMQHWEDRLPNSHTLDDAQSVRIRR